MHGEKRRFLKTSSFSLSRRISFSFSLLKGRQWEVLPLVLCLFLHFFRRRARQFQSRVCLEVRWVWGFQRESVPVWWFCRYPYSEYHDFFQSNVLDTVSNLKDIVDDGFDFFRWVFSLHLAVLTDMYVVSQELAVVGTLQSIIPNDRQSHRWRWSFLHKAPPCLCARQYIYSTVQTSPPASRTRRQTA
jgi:hypothetical protein